MISHGWLAAPTRSDKQQLGEQLISGAQPAVMQIATHRAGPAHWAMMEIWLKIFPGSLTSKKTPRIHTVLFKYCSESL